MERVELKRLALATGVAELRGATVFLCDPKWGPAERTRFAALLTPTPNVELPRPFPSYQPPLSPGEAGPGWLCIATGGSGGALKFARHDEHTLGAAVAGFCTHFSVGRVNAVDVLPPHHVSGFMARVRCAATGGTHVAWDWKRLEAGDRPAPSPGDWVLSLVPTQLQRLLASVEAVAWLRTFRVIFIGGAPVWPELTESAAAAGLRLSLSYGMTETAAMATALRPEEFLAGARSSGSPLPHAKIAIGGGGLVSVEGGSVFRGYFPEYRESRRFETADLGRIDACGHLHVLGRADAAIITGGEKVQPLEVEAALRASGEFADVAVIGVRDPAWGEIVVACHPVSATASPSWERVRDALAGLAPYKRPKRYVAIPSEAWPRNVQGKLNRLELARRATDNGKNV